MQVRRLSTLQGHTFQISEDLLPEMVAGRPEFESVKDLIAWLRDSGFVPAEGFDDYFGVVLEMPETGELLSVTEDDRHDAD